MARVLSGLRMTSNFLCRRALVVGFRHEKCWKSVVTVIPSKCYASKPPPSEKPKRIGEASGIRSPTDIKKRQDNRIAFGLVLSVLMACYIMYTVIETYRIQAYRNENMYWARREHEKMLNRQRVMELMELEAAETKAEKMELEAAETKAEKKD